jgi:hypothetical protein
MDNHNLSILITFNALKERRPFNRAQDVSASFTAKTAIIGRLAV